MTSRPLSGASVHAKLRNLAQATGNMNAALPNLQVGYVQQGFLARLAVSPYLEHFVVKGGVTMLARYGDRARPTRDIDLSAQGIDSDVGAVRAIIQEICAIDHASGALPADDALEFPQAFTAEMINEQRDVPGIRVVMAVGLRGTNQRLHLQLDVTFNTGSVLPPMELEFPPVLLPEGVRFAAYPLEVMVSDKFAALVDYGIGVSRMNDLHDLWLASSREGLDAGVLRDVMERSWPQRNTRFDDVPSVLAPDFVVDAELERKWGRYARDWRGDPTSLPPDLGALVARVAAYAGAVASGERTAGIWDPELGAWNDLA